MKRALILHGMPSKKEYYDPDVLSMSNLHWLPWLQSQLIKRDIQAHTPEIPHSYAPEWPVWRHEIERYEIDEETALVGHSCGAGFWVRYLSENRQLNVGKVILIGPWLDPDGDETDGFFKFTIDPKLIDRTNGLTIFNSDNDMGNVHKSVAFLREHLPGIGYKEFRRYGHFTHQDMGSKEFPELLEEILLKP